MISLANENTSAEVRHLWKTCFNDPEEFIELYFSEKYKNENTLVWIENSEVVASLQMLPYLFTFCGVEVPVAYISGACTLEKYRNRGYMSKLLIEAFNIMRVRNIPLSILIPANDWLYEYYSKFGYSKVFDTGVKPIPLKEIFDKANGNIDAAYHSFDKLYRKKDFCVQKTKEDFITILKDAIVGNFPLKCDVSGMARIIDAKLLLSYYAAANYEKSLAYKITDNIIDENNFSYEIKNDNFSIINKENEIQTVDIIFLCRLLFGYHLEDLPKELAQNFVSHTPIMNLMLEDDI